MYIYPHSRSDFLRLELLMQVRTSRTIANKVSAPNVWKRSWLVLFLSCRWPFFKSDQYNCHQLLISDKIWETILMAFHYERSTRSLSVDYPVVGRHHAISLEGQSVVWKKRPWVPKSKSIEFKVDWDSYQSGFSQGWICYMLVLGEKAICYAR